MTATGELKADPVGFVKHNMLIVTDPDIWYPKQHQLDRQLRARLMLIDMVAEGYTIRPGPPKKSSFFGIKRGQKTPARGLYRVVMAGSDAPRDDTFLAYICPFKADIGGSMVLGSAADIMVTAEMSGCTFGIGSEGGKSKARMVMHANAASAATGADDAGMAPQVKAQHDMVTGGLGSKAKMWKPGQYRKVDGDQDIDMRSTIIGIRSGKSGSWHFYAQTYNASGADRTMIEVVKVC